jgi:arginyl-tRNA synthetase
MKAYIAELITQAVTELWPNMAPEVLSGVNFDVSYPKPEFGDYASNAAMMLFKRFAEKPAVSPLALAEVLAERCSALDKQATFSSVVAAAGFINFTLADSWLVHEMGKYQSRAGLQTEPNTSAAPVIIEYFQNNVAKPPHIGHLRSAVLGDSLVRIYKFLGYNIVTDTHVGDWGTQFGILLYAYKTMGDRAVIERDPIIELNKLYVAMSAKIEQQPELRDFGKAEFQKLEAGNEENRELWHWFVEVSMADFEKYRQLLKLQPFDYNYGESFYEDKMPAVLQELADKGLVTTGETGELYVDLEADGLGRCILQKSDGASTYHLRDFATYLYRKAEFTFDRNVYIVDSRQAHHFKQLFRVLEKAGYPAETDSLHVDFGFMSLPEGPISTRKGTVISLEKLLEEATSRAAAIISEKNPDLPNAAHVAEQVGLAAVKYFDLSHNRRTDIVFTWDTALSFEGNTGPYLQYTHARIQSILRKADIMQPASGYEISHLELAERTVLRQLQQFPAVLEQAAKEFMPSHLCTYLFGLAQSYNSFYQSVPVLQETDSHKRAFRLALCQATATVISTGLDLLGITAPEQM